jgi:hypothetical protein
MRYFIFWINLCLTLNLLSQLPSKYQVRFGSIGDDAANSIIKETDGSFVLTGYSIDSATNQSRTFVWKIANNFSFIWQKSLGNSIGQGKSIKKVFNKGYVTCGFISNSVTNYDGFITRLDNNGDTLWTRSVGTNAWDFLNKIIVTDDSGFIAVGKSYGTATFDSDAWLIKLDKNGNVLWSKFYGGFEDDELNGIEAIQKNYIAVGVSRSAGDLDGDTYFIKINENGDTIKTRTISKLGVDICNGITKVDNNTYHCVGGSIDFPKTLMSNSQVGIDSNLNTISTYTNFNSYINGFTYFTESTLLSDNRLANTGAGINYSYFKLDIVSNLINTNGSMIFFTYLNGSSLQNDEGLSICSNFEDSSFTICGYTEGNGANQKDVIISKNDKTGNTSPTVNVLTHLRNKNTSENNYTIWKENGLTKITNISNKNLQIKLFDISGRKLLFDVFKISETKNLSETQQNILLIQIISNNATHTEKIILNQP